MVSPLKVKFGECLAATYALSNLINSRDRVSGSPYCLVSPSHVNAKTDVTPRLWDNNNWVNPWCGLLCRFNNSELKIRRRRDSTTADLVEGAWGEVAVAMARKIALRKLAGRRVVVAAFSC